MQEEVLKVVQQITKSLTKLAWVKAITIAGSALINDLSQISDIDFLIYHESLPGVVTRKKYYQLYSLQDKKRPASFNLKVPPLWIMDKFYSPEGIKLDLTFIQIRHFEKILDDILKRGETDRKAGWFYPICLLSDLKNSLVLHDPSGIFKKWRAKSKKYPIKARKQIIKTNFFELSYNLKELKNASERDDYIYFLHCLNACVENFVQIVFALNEVYYPGNKRSLEYFQHFQLKPIDFEEILNNLIATPNTLNCLSKKFQICKKLTEEIKSLVTTFVKDVNLKTRI